MALGTWQMRNQSEISTSDRRFPRLKAWVRSSVLREAQLRDATHEVAFFFLATAFCAKVVHLRASPEF